MPAGKAKEPRQALPLYVQGGASDAPAASLAPPYAIRGPFGPNAEALCIVLTGLHRAHELWRDTCVWWNQR